MNTQDLLKLAPAPPASKHTPGPWHAMHHLPASYSDHGYRRVADLGRADLVIYAEAKNMLQAGKGFCWGKAEDDARLLAASPDLLAALVAAEKYLTHLINQHYGQVRRDDAASHDSTVLQMRAAIKKAVNDE